MMSRGTKRGSSSDTAPDSAGFSMLEKRTMFENSFGPSKEDSSHQFAEPSVDAKLAESAHRHVRALNTQFASWIQSQLQNHPDELWDDGVGDYLTHASGIMEKFSDVVSWLKAKSMKAPETVTFAPVVRHNNVYDGSEKNKENVQLKSIFGQNTAASSLSNSWSSVATFSSPTSVFGTQSPLLTKQEPVDDQEEENDLEKPSSPSLKRTEENGIILVHEVKCKVYVKPDNPAEKGWKDMGVGMLSIKCKEGASKATKESKPTIIVRNDVGKILLNALIYPGITINTQKNSITSIFHTLGGGDADGNAANTSEAAVARTYLLRTKAEEETTKLAAAIKEYAPVV